jgi:hypothetical protein
MLYNHRVAHKEKHLKKILLIIFILHFKNISPICHLGHFPFR